MFTENDIYKSLKEAGIPRGPVTLCHTSLRHVGSMENGGDTLLNALIRYFTEDGGLLAIPTHTWANIGKDTVTCDMASAEVCIGTLPRLALLRPDGHRSEHPTHSMVVFGEDKKAEDFIKDEPLFDTPCNPGGCYGKLYTMGGAVLLIGVGLERLTYLHSVEEMYDVPDRITEERRDLTIRLKDGNTVHRLYHTHHGISAVPCTWSVNPSDHFMKMETAFRTCGALRDLTLGNARSLHCDCRIMKEVYGMVYENAAGQELFCDDVPIPEKWYRKK